MTMRLFLAIALAWAGAAAAQEINRIVAVVNDDVITALELDAEADEVERALMSRGAAVPARSVLRERVLNALINRQLQMQEADALGVEISDDELDRRIGEFKKENRMSDADLRRYVEEELGEDFDKFRADVRDDLRIGAALRRQILARIHVSEGEIDDFLRAETGAGARDEFRVSRILIALSEGAAAVEIEEKRALAADLQARAAGGEDFTQLAVEYSDAGDALEGGDLGWRRASELPGVFLLELQNLAAGEVGRVIESSNGFHILRLAERRLASAAGEVVRRRVAHILLDGEDAREQLVALRGRFERGESFADLAREYSVDQATAKEGGDLGWAVEGGLLPELEAALVELGAGEVSDPVRSPFGWHLLRVTEMERSEIDAEELRRRALGALRERRALQAQESWRRRLRNAAYIELRPVE